MTGTGGRKGQGEEAMTLKPSSVGHGRQTAKHSPTQKHTFCSGSAAPDARSGVKKCCRRVDISGNNNFQTWCFGL